METYTVDSLDEESHYKCPYCDEVLDITEDWELEGHIDNHKLPRGEMYCLHRECTESTKTFNKSGLTQHTCEVHGSDLISVTPTKYIIPYHTCSGYYECDGMPPSTYDGPEWDGDLICNPLCTVDLISASSSYKGAEDCLTNAGGPDLQMASWGHKGQNLADDCPHSTTRIESCSNDSYETLYFVYRATDPEAYIHLGLPSGTGGGVSITWTGIIMKISEDEFDPSAHIIITE